MSATFSSTQGALWAQRQRARIPSIAHREALDRLAAYFNLNGEGWPSVGTLCNDCGGYRSRGSMKRSLNWLAKQCFIAIQRTTGGHHQATNKYVAIDWNGALRDPTPGRTEPVSEPASEPASDPTPQCVNTPIDGTPACTPPDSTVNGTGLQGAQDATPVESQINKEETRGREREEGAADAAPPPAAKAGPAEVQGRKKLSMPAWAFEEWNRQAKMSRLIVASSQGKLFPAIDHALKHAAIGNLMTNWIAYVGWLADHHFYGDASLWQAVKLDTIDRWAKEAAPRRNRGLEVKRAPTARCDDTNPEAWGNWAAQSKTQSIAPSDLPADFDATTDPQSCFVRESLRQMEVLRAR